MSPFLLCEAAHDGAQMVAMAQRSVLVKRAYELWSVASTLEEVGSVARGEHLTHVTTDLQRPRVSWRACLHSCVRL